MNFNFDIKDLPSNAIKNSSANTLSYIINNMINNTFENITGIYNKGVYWPDEVEFAVQYTLSQKYRILPTQHLFDKLKLLNLPFNCYKAMLYGTVVEAELNHGVVKKVITRLPNRFNKDETLCAAIAFDLNINNKNIVAHVKTIWTNRTEDNHRTIHKENYITKGV